MNKKKKPKTLTVSMSSSHGRFQVAVEMAKQVNRCKSWSKIISMQKQRFAKHLTQPTDSQRLWPCSWSEENVRPSYTSTLGWPIWRNNRYFAWYFDIGLNFTFQMSGACWTCLWRYHRVGWRDWLRSCWRCLKLIRWERPVSRIPCSILKCHCAPSQTSSSWPTSPSRPRPRQRCSSPRHWFRLRRMKIIIPMVVVTAAPTRPNLAWFRINGRQLHGAWCRRSSCFTHSSRFDGFCRSATNWPFCGIIIPWWWRCRVNPARDWVTRGFNQLDSYSSICRACIQSLSNEIIEMSVYRPSPLWWTAQSSVIFQLAV